MRCTVAELQARMSSREFAEWLADYRIDPWDELARGDLQAALVAQTVANSMRDSEKHPNPYPFDDFVLKFREDPPEETEEKLYARALSILGPLGATVEDA